MYFWVLKAFDAGFGVTKTVATRAYFASRCRRFREYPDNPQRSSPNPELLNPHYRQNPKSCKSNGRTPNLPSTRQYPHESGQVRSFRGSAKEACLLIESRGQAKGPAWG